jgi:hypothetical protein
MLAASFGRASLVFGVAGGEVSGVACGVIGRGESVGRVGILCQVLR